MNIVLGEIDEFNRKIEFERNLNDKVFTITGVNKSGISGRYYRLSRTGLKKRKSDSDKFESIFQDALEPYRQGKK